MKRALIALVLVMMMMLAVPAVADVAWVMSASPVTLTSSEIRPSHTMQAKVVFCGQTTQQWASSMGVFMTGIPTGEAVKGIYVRVYPRPLPGAAKMFATRAEDLPASVDLKDPRLFELPRESSGMCGPEGGGSYYYDFDPNLYPGPGAIRFYALIKNGKRWELRIIWFIGITGKSNSSQMTSVFEYTTAPWSGPTPDPAYMRVMAERAGAGGRGGEYEDLALEQWEKQQAIEAAKVPVAIVDSRSNHEKISEFVSVTKRAGNSSRLVTFKLKFVGNFSEIGMVVSSPDGGLDSNIIYSSNPTTTLSLPSGQNNFDLLVDYGTRMAHQKPISIDVDPSDRVITIQIGGR